MKQKSVPPAFEKAARSFQSWNSLTAECYINKMCCDLCSNKEDCSIETIHQNPYKISNIKYAVLMTYSNIGVKGIETYYAKMGNPQSYNRR